MLKIKGINRNIVKTLEFWLTNFSTSVRWGDCYSNQVSMLSGVRQGGVLSPLLFACYVDCLLVNLENSGLGCFVLKSCLNSFMYAYDLILLSISVSDLQKMINLCNLTLEDLDLEINAIKSHCLRIGPRSKSICCSVFVNNVPLEWVTSTKFLGVSILSANCFSCDWHDARSNFYKSLNTILGNLGVSPAVDVALNLIVSKCVPLLMYGLSAISISSSELNKLTFAYNSIFCKLFHVKSTETIKLCQFFSSSWEFKYLYDFYRLCFLNNLFNKGLLCASCHIDNYDYNEFCLLLSRYNVNIWDSKRTMKFKFWNYINLDITSFTA